MAAATINANAPATFTKDFRTPVVSYTPSMWEDTFSSFTLDHQVQEKYAKAIEVLSDEVRSMLTMAKGKTNMNKKDLCELSRWWNDLKSQLPYARNRVVETYLWGTAFHFKPQYSYVRMAVAKTIQMLTIIDDTYDNYATIEEADIFTEALQRWNADEIDRLPDYMKIIYKLILTVYEEYEIEAAKRGKSFSVPHAKETVKQLCTGYNLGLKWYMRAQTPSFEDYVTNLTIIGCLYAICAGTIPGMKSVSEETIDWLRSEPEIAKASSKVCRYLDDVSGYERESGNGQFLTGMDIYMKQYGTTIQETADKFLELAKDAWKDLNTEWMAVTNHGVPKDMLEQILGYARAGEIFYRSCQDGYMKTEIMAPQICALFADPIAITI